MAFGDWWDIIGTGIQSLFAWTTFNRDAFADNVGWRQNQKYQQKNYHISWISVARDDIRDMMSISVNRLNNFMIVNGLILGVAGSAITSSSFNTKAPPYLVAAFLICVATSVVFLVLAIMFGIKGQNCAFTNTMKLLTWEMRPENPADYNHDYMSQAQWIEKNGLQQMFRIPGIMPNYKTDPNEHEDDLPDYVKRLRHQATMKGYDTKGMKGDEGHAHSRKNEGRYVAEDFTALEHLEVSSKSLWYLTKFGHFMRLWMPYDTYCKYAMGMGMLALGHAGAYFTMGTLLSGGWDVPAYASVFACFAFVYMVALVIQQNFSKDMPVFGKLLITIILCCGPTLGVFAAATKSSWANYLWIACFTFHFVFWSGCCLATFSKKVLRPSRLGQVGTEGGFWGSHEQNIRTVGEEGVDGAQPAADTVGNGLHPEHQGKEHHDWNEWEDSGSGSDTDGSSTYRSTASSKGGQVAKSSSPAAGKWSAQSERSREKGHGGNQAISGHGKWPTDDDEFDEKVDDTSQKVRAALQQTIIVCAIVWFALLTWVIADTVFLAIDSPWQRVYPSEQVQSVSWGSPFLRPTRIACGEVGGNLSTFVADAYNIYSVSDGAVTIHDKVDCRLDSTIKDISSYCTGARCWPVALTQDGHVVDCQSGVADQLLKVGDPSVIGVYVTDASKPFRHQRLVVGSSSALDDLVQLYYSRESKGWTPEYALTFDTDDDETGETHSRTAVSVSNGRLLSFYETEPDRPAIYRHNMADMKSDDGPWSLTSKAAPVVGGCAFAQANYAMVLPKPQDKAQTIVRLDFVSTHSAFS